MYTLLYTSAAFYILSLLYTLSYILHSPAYFTPLLYTPLLYTLLYAYYIHSLIYILLYTPLYTLLYTLIALLILSPPFYTSPLSLIPFLSYILAPLIFIFLYSHIVIPTLLYRKGITTLPPIFTRFTSLS